MRSGLGVKTHIALSIVSTKFAVQKSLERVAEEWGVRVEDGLEQPVVVGRPKLGEGHVEVFSCLPDGDRRVRVEDRVLSFLCGPLLCPCAVPEQSIWSSAASCNLATESYTSTLVRQGDIIL